MIAPTQAFPPGDRTVPTMLRRQAEHYGERMLVITEDGSWTYTQALAAASRAACALAAAGVSQGDRVAILSGNRLAFLETVLGCAWLGAVFVPINTASKGPQIEYILKNCGARLLVAEAELLSAIDLADLTHAPLEKILTFGPAPAASIHGRACDSWALGADEREPAPSRPGDMLAILYTSGTTGPSKGVCCPHAQYFWWGVHSAAALELRDGDVLMTTLPLFHINALNTLAQAMLVGGTYVLEPRFSASSFWASAARHGATVTYLLGAMVPILLSREPSPLERDHRVRLALGPGVPPNLHDVFKQRTGVDLLEAYGSTETNFVLGRSIGDQKLGAMGRVRDGFEAKVVDHEDNEVADGEAGELALRASEPFAFATGYFGMPEKTVEAWRNLWFHTGDRVIRDYDGYFKFVDRLKDAIRRRGENISSFEVEQVLLSHPAIAAAAVYPVASDLAEDEVMAAIVKKPGATFDETALMAFCEERMPYFSVPRYILAMADLPRTENGKIQKYKLRDAGVTADAWDREAAGYVLKRRR